MPLYAIKGLHRDDASPLAPLTIKAATEDEAVKIANAKGIVVESAERVVHRTPPWLAVLLAITLLLIMGGTCLVVVHGKQFEGRVPLSGPADRSARIEGAPNPGIARLALERRLEQRFRRRPGADHQLQAELCSRQC
jgi:hypothetical protein